MPLFKPFDTSSLVHLVDVGVPNGVAGLDGVGKVPSGQLPASVVGALNYKGTWNATTNIPTLSNSGGGGVQGDYYVVSVAGATPIEGITDWNIGDWLVNNGSTWDKLDNTEPVIAHFATTGQTVNDHHNQQHALGGSDHTSATLAQLNALVSDAVLDDSGDSRTDTDAIHDNVNGEISVISEKTVPVIADLVVIEDSESSNAKKRVQLGNLPYPTIYDRLSWSMSPISNGTVQILGWNIQTDIAASLTSAVPVTAAEAGFHSHFIVDISAAVGAPFTLRITGRSINEATGVTTPADTEDIAVTGNGYYQSAKSWIDAVQFSIVEGSKSCTLDIYRNTYWDRGNKNFTIDGMRLEWTPDSPSWSIQLQIFHVQNNGSLVSIDDVTFANGDAILRASNGSPGKHKRSDYTSVINGAQKEGIIVVVTQTSILNFYLEVKYHE